MANDDTKTDVEPEMDKLQRHMRTDLRLALQRAEEGDLYSSYFHTHAAAAYHDRIVILQRANIQLSELPLADSAPISEPNCRASGSSDE